jgi:NAD(P)-dependent dehydrogenase (short-subunit alcohol dehydrogenase family)
MRRVEGKIAIVTGGAGGIGKAMCRRLVDEGARVAVADMFLQGAEEFAHELGASAIAVAIDAEDSASVAGAIEKVVGHFGALNILVNNAALTDAAAMMADKTALDIDLDLYDRTMAVNARGYVAGCKYALPHLIDAGGGSIVNTASGAGQLGNDQWIAYGMSKAAVIQLTRSVATAFGKQGVRCNAIAPYVILTPHSREYFPKGLQEIYERHTLVPRLGEVNDMADLTLYLASDEAGFVTGQVFNCDGGASAQHGNVPDIRDWMKANS